MGSESCNSTSNSCKSDSDSSSNSGDSNSELQKIEFLVENENIIINRVWIAKKSIKLTNRHVKLSSMNPFYNFQLKNKESKEEEVIVRLNKNIFNLNSFPNYEFKHWAIIMELSNNTFVNIQFGRNGFSLKEFNKTDIECESVFNSILEIWGEDSAPISFCYLGNANYKYETLKQFLNSIKEKETKNVNENKKTFYNLCFYNCQHFACDIEKHLFGKIKVWHSFEIYLKEFFTKFFADKDITKLKLKYELELKKRKNRI